MKIFKSCLIFDFFFYRELLESYLMKILVQVQTSCVSNPAIPDYCKLKDPKVHSI